MSDLRAMLGDRYSDAIDMAVGVMIQQVAISSARRKNGGREPTQHEVALESKWFNPHPSSKYAALRNAYGGRAVESRFERLAHDVPAVQCGGCVFRGLEVETC